MYTLADTGASGIAFIDKRFLCYIQLRTSLLIQPRKLQALDGRETSLGEITYTTQLALSFEGHFENIIAYVTRIWD